MAYLTYDLTPQWVAPARFTAAGNVPMEIVNPMESGYVHYVITDTDDVPGLPIGRAGRVFPSGAKGLTLLTGERLWLTSEAQRAVATVNY